MRGAFVPGLIQHVQQNNPQSKIQTNTLKTSPDEIRSNQMKTNLSVDDFKINSVWQC